MNITGLTGKNGTPTRKKRTVEKHSQDGTFGGFLTSLVKGLMVIGVVAGLAYFYCAQDNAIVQVEEDITRIEKAHRQADRDLEKYRNEAARLSNLSNISRQIQRFGLKLRPTRHSQQCELRVMPPEQVARSQYLAPADFRRTAGVRRYGNGFNYARY